MDFSSLLKHPPGEGTGPTERVGFLGIPVGRVPQRGAREVFQRAVRPHFSHASGSAVFLWLRSAELHSAVSRICNPLNAQETGRLGAVEGLAESNSAIQQIENLRYVKSSRLATIPGDTDRLEICATSFAIRKGVKCAVQVPPLSS